MPMIRVTDGTHKALELLSIRTGVPMTKIMDTLVGQALKREIRSTPDCESCQRQREQQAQNEG